jgi:hypothetical protein
MLKCIGLIMTDVIIAQARAFFNTRASKKRLPQQVRGGPYRWQAFL